jgi:hypothetical protein
MTPANSNQPIINPRELLRKQGPAALARLLATTGYMVQGAIERFGSDPEWHADLVEGPRGGKTL